MSATTLNNILHISDETFDEEVVRSDVPVLVDFWADWCGPCHALAPILEAFAESLGEQVKIAKVNVDENVVTARRFGIRSIPTLVVVHGGDGRDTLVGVQSLARLKAALDPYL